MKQKKCQAKGCGTEFTPIKPTQKYCSHACKNRAAARRRQKLAKIGRQVMESAEARA